MRHTRAQSQAQEIKQKNWERRILIEIPDSPQVLPLTHLHRAGQTPRFELSSGSSDPSDSSDSGSYSSTGDDASGGHASSQSSDSGMQVEGGRRAAEDLAEDVSEPDDASTLSFPRDAAKQASQEADSHGDEASSSEQEEPRQVALTGRFARGHAELGKLLKERGHAHVPNVTKACTDLVVAELGLDDQKTRAARRYDVPMRDVAWLTELLGLESI